MQRASCIHPWLISVIAALTTFMSAAGQILVNAQGQFEDDDHGLVIITGGIQPIGLRSQYAYAHYIQDGVLNTFPGARNIQWFTAPDHSAASWQVAVPSEERYTLWQFTPKPEDPRHLALRREIEALQKQLDEVRARARTTIETFDSEHARYEHADKAIHKLNERLDRLVRERAERNSEWRDAIASFGPDADQTRKAKKALEKAQRVVQDTEREKEHEVAVRDEAAHIIGPLKKSYDSWKAKIAAAEKALQEAKDRLRSA